MQPESHGLRRALLFHFPSTALAISNWVCGNLLAAIARTAKVKLEEAALAKSSIIVPKDVSKELQIIRVIGG